MLVNSEKKSLKLYNIPIRENVSQWIEQDILVPDTKPDAIKIINVNVNAYVSDIEVMDSRVKVVGKLNYFVIYKTNETNMGIRGMYMTYPYTTTLNIKNIKKDMKVVVKPNVKNIIYSLPNERKISVKTEVIFYVKASEFVDLNLIQRFDDECNIQTKMNTCNCCNNLATKYNIIASKEDVLLPKENEDFYEILKIDTSVINKDYKESYNKIMVKGDILVNMLYLVDNQETDIKKATFEIPFSGMVEMDNINDKSKFVIDYTINDFNIKPNPDITSTKTMNVDYQIGINVRMYENEDVSYVEDFYSEDRNLKCDYKAANAVYCENVTNKNIDIKETLNNVVPDNSRILDYNIDLSYLIVKHLNNEINAEGSIKINLLIQKLDTLELENKNVDILVNENFNIENMLKNSNITLKPIIEKINIMQNGNDLEVKIRLNIEIKEEDILALNYAENIESEDLDLNTLDSMYLYIVKPKDTLWSIAKKYKTTVNKIVQTNNIENPDSISPNQKLLIIR